MNKWLLHIQQHTATTERFAKLTESVDQETAQQTGTLSVLSGTVYTKT